MIARRDVLRRLGLTAVFTATMSALTAVFPEVANAACVENGCKCRPGTSPGVYCGWCYAVTHAGEGGAWSDVFQCASNGRCCRWGPRPSCADSDSYTPCG
ncbi:hypothetical protein APR12_004605 [Nocardia amikacinitolerans]|nr:hypothetical protein [Nocardia amikacinitolerans]